MALGVLLAAVLFAIGPFVFPFAGFDPADFTNPDVDTSIQPPGWAFSIWGLIHAWLLVSALAGVTVRRNADAWRAHRLLLFVALGIGAIWLPISERSPVAATGLIWAMLLTTVAALVRTPLTDRWLLRVPIALLAGWLTAASSVSLGIVGPGYSFAFSGTLWQVIAVGIAIFVATAVHIKLGQLPEYGVPLVWGFGSIMIGAIGVNTLVAALAFVAAAWSIVLMLWSPQLSLAFRERTEPDL